MGPGRHGDSTGIAKIFYLTGIFDLLFWDQCPMDGLTILVYMNAYLYIQTGCVVCLVALVVGSTYVSHCMVYPHHTTSSYTSHKVHDTTSISEDYIKQEDKTSISTNSKYIEVQTI